ncbi:MAG TPA: AMP-binding protein, partial [Methylomirabilota bacterium]|nr:AMP-binding protein [Methylomirabilota bacterium]
MDRSSADWPPPTSRDLLAWAAARYRDADAVVHRDRRVSFAGLLDASGRLAAGLRARGIQRGDRVGMWLPNWPEWIFARHALGILGAVAVPINTRYKPEELAYCLRQGECRALLSADRFLGIDFRASVESVRDGVPTLEWIAYPDELTAMLAGPPLPRGEWPEMSPDDVGYLIYTSGTTSFSKGVQLTHRNLSRNAVAAGRAVDLRAGERLLIAVPLFSSFGTCHLSFAALSA